MSDLRQTLNQVLAGSSPPSAFLAAVDEFLAKDDANIDALRAVIDAAEHLGLDAETAAAARERIAGALGDKTQVIGDDPAEGGDVFGIGEPTRVADDEDSDRTELTTGQQPTRLRADPADVDPDRTVAIDDDATVQVDGDDATVQVAGDDPFAMAASKPAGGEDHGPGSVLKDRFRLEEVIGQGGMGAVYKAVDLLKVEARDRNPYIAVKLLVGDFKEHPEAFIALQRESAKAQRLAHPNIATVYDFDRDGETVYMTMELMVGAELAKYIKKLPAGGLPVPDAMKVIEQLCAGLQYAHARGLVHSDFKPGNAFLLDDGTVKLLDFGIARASKTKADADGEKTVFDPGQLGALTPAYATIEMFEGQDPDPRDDIYALACVAYELLTGKHPFNKMSAVKANEKKLKPAPVEKLTKRQNRTLLKAMALHRDDRLGSVELFWEGIRPRKDYTWHIAGAATAATVLLAVLLYNPIMNFIHEREHGAIVTELAAGDDARLVAALAQIDLLPDARRRVVAERARERIVDYFQTRAEYAIDESEARYDYPAALAEVAELERYFPDSAQVNEIRRDIEGRRINLVSGLREEFGELLEAGQVMPDPDEPDITEVLVKLRAAQPGDGLLSDPRLIRAYAERANAQAEAGNWQEADRIVAVGLEFASRDPALLDLRDGIALELRREQEAALVASLRETLRDAGPRSLAQFREVREELERLRQLRPDDAAVRALDGPLRAAIDGGLADAAESGDWAAADVLLIEFARTLPIDELVERRQALTQRQVAAGYDMSGDAERLADLEARAAELRGLLAEPAFDDEFERALAAVFKDVTARLTADTGTWDALRTEIAEVYIEHARALIADNRFGVATATLASGQRFHPSLDLFSAERASLAEAESAYRAEQAQRERLAAIDATKNQIRGYIEGGNLGTAVESFNALRGELATDDPFVTTEAPQAIAAAYVALADSAAEGGNFSNAVRFAQAGLEVLPGHDGLQQLLTRNQSRAAMQEVTNAAGSATAANFGAFRTRYNNARQGLAAADARAFEGEVVSALAARMQQLDRARGDIREANALHAAALQLFPGHQALTRLTLRQPSEHAPRVQASIEGNRLTEARALLADAQRAERDHPDLAQVGERLAQREQQATGLYQQARGMIGTDSTGACRLIGQALDAWSDNADFASFRGSNCREPGECHAALAGHGRRGAAQCYDTVAGQTGPRLVVIPAPSGGAAFAIGRQEVSIGEFNHYCQSSGECQPLGGDAALPVTNISIQQADAYAAWLSQQSGARYRIPSDAEWVHAAGGGGDPGRSGDFNCRVVSGGNVIKGHSLMRATAGATNAWGVMNAVGNAQEWVRAGGTLQARGGSYQDPLTNCDINLSRSHGGSADEVTGFRVMRTID